ncbi:alpha-amylase family glycosyl hydrolase [Corallincola platygyrae]|uniref:Alpha-amylase family glycosyl hydrolase n=1 Tax=Corallincola platygyrae TaxID=1193278 RepID=A0ABW4XP89_9GAMM
MIRIVILLSIITLAGCSHSKFEKVVPTTNDTWHIQAKGAEILDENGNLLGSTQNQNQAELTLPINYADRLWLGSRDESALAVKLGQNNQALRTFDHLIIYHIMVGYFANGEPGNDRVGLSHWVGPNYAGGDLQGVLSKLDYLQALGVNAIWLSPTFPSFTSHGYDPANYFAVNGALAYPGQPAKSLALLKQVIDEAHHRGLKVFLDLPLNHGASNYDRANGDPNGLQPKTTGNRQPEEVFFDSIGANFGYWDEKDPNTRRFLKDAALFWLNEFDVDGYRLDYVLGMEKSFWAELYQEIKAQKPDAFVLGEVWLDNHAAPTELTEHYRPVDGIGLQFDSLIEFPTRYALERVFAGGRSLTLIEEYLQAVSAAYPTTAHPAWFLDNHDMPRFTVMNGDPRRLEAAVKFMSALSGPMIVYYGTETALTHTYLPDMHASRVPMPWDNLNDEMLSKSQTIFHTRQQHPALYRGGRLPLVVQDDYLVMAKTTPEEIILVGVNLTDAPVKVEIELGSLLDELGNVSPLAGDSEWQMTGNSLTWLLPAMGTHFLHAN